MIPRSIGIVGIFLIVACSSAQAYSEDSDNGDAPGAWQQDAPNDQPAADYRYSGNGFNVSVSRNLPQQNGAATSQESGAEQQQSSRSRPGFFKRMLRGILGND